MFVHARSALPKTTFNHFITNEIERIEERCSNNNEKTILLNRFNQVLTLRGHRSENFKPLRRRPKTDDQRFFLNVPFINDEIDNMVKKALKPLGLKICLSHKTKTLKSLLTKKMVPNQAICNQFKTKD
jgi:hypothetical protein